MIPKLREKILTDDEKGKRCGEMGSFYHPSEKDEKQICFLKPSCFFVDTDSKDVEEIKRKQTQSHDGLEQIVFQDVWPRFRFCPSLSGFFSVSKESKFRDVFSFLFSFFGSREHGEFL